MSTKIVNYKTKLTVNDVTGILNFREKKTTLKKHSMKIKSMVYNCKGW